MTRPSAPDVAATPIWTAAFDALLAANGIDVVLATSRHNVRYLLGGYSYFLYERLDAIGPSRYLPVLGYAAGRPGDAFYVGAGNESWGTDADVLWVPSIDNVAWSSTEAASAAAAALHARGLGAATIGIEPAYVPTDAIDALRDALPGATFVDATDQLEELRAIKTERELETMRVGSSAVVDAMLATFAAGAPGMTTSEVAERLRLEQTARGLNFDYCLVATGSSDDRAPSTRAIEPGAVLSIDSGADLHGYTADLTRMGIAGEPTDRHDDLLAQVDAVQQAARDGVTPGRRGGDLFDLAAAAMAELADGSRMTFLAHGTGLLTHEAPRLTDTGSPPYPATHRDRPLEPGMVVSIETHVVDPELGFVKLEDTVIVTADGHEAVGDHGRGWNRVGA